MGQKLPDKVAREVHNPFFHDKDTYEKYYAGLSPEHKNWHLTYDQLHGNSPIPPNQTYLIELLKIAQENKNGVYGGQGKKVGKGEQLVLEKVVSNADDIETILENLPDSSQADLSSEIQAGLQNAVKRKPDALVPSVAGAQKASPTQSTTSQKALPISTSSQSTAQTQTALSNSGSSTSSKPTSSSSSAGKGFGKPKKGKIPGVHQHHICPRYMQMRQFKVDNDAAYLKNMEENSCNLITVTPKQHARLHKAAHEQFKEQNDSLAYSLLSGHNEDAHRIISSLGGKALAALNRLNKLGFFSSKVQKENSRKFFEKYGKKAFTILSQNGQKGDPKAKQLAATLSAYSEAGQASRKKVGKIAGMKQARGRIVTKYDRLTIKLGQDQYEFPRFPRFETPGEILKYLNDHRNAWPLCNVIPSHFALPNSEVLSRALKNGLDKAYTGQFGFPVKGWSFRFDPLTVPERLQAIAERQSRQPIKRRSFVPYQTVLFIYKSGVLLYMLPCYKSPHMSATDVLKKIREEAKKYPKRWPSLPQSFSRVLADALDRHENPTKIRWLNTDPRKALPFRKEVRSYSFDILPLYALQCKSLFSQNLGGFSRTIYTNVLYPNGVAVKPPSASSAYVPYKKRRPSKPVQYSAKSTALPYWCQVRRQMLMQRRYPQIYP